MKNTTIGTKTKNTRFNANKHRPENKDDLDSRKNEEQQFKGDDTTHNHKDHRGTPKEKNKK